MPRSLPAAAGARRRTNLTPAALALYHPFCSSNPVSSWPGGGGTFTISRRAGRSWNRLQLASAGLLHYFHLVGRRNKQDFPERGVSP